MNNILHTPFSIIYDNFLSKITDDMFMELTELDTFRILQELLISAIPKFEFPRKNLIDYELEGIVDEGEYQGIESDNELVKALIYGGGYFEDTLTFEEVNILSTYMIVEWFGYQLASVENIRMKYSGSDFKFTSQANHMQKILTLKKDYEREGFHLQRLYKRRTKDEDGIMRSTLDIIMRPVQRTKSSSTSSVTATTSNTCNCNCEEEIKKVAEHCDENTAQTKEYVNSLFSWEDFP